VRDFSSALARQLLEAEQDALDDSIIAENAGTFAQP